MEVNTDKSLVQQFVGRFWKFEIISAHIQNIMLITAFLAIYIYCTVRRINDIRAVQCVLLITFHSMILLNYITINICNLYMV